VFRSINGERHESDPTVAWTAQQVIEAFPHDSAPRFLIRDRDSIFGGQFRRRVKAIGLPRSSSRRTPRGRTLSRARDRNHRRELLDT